MAPTTPLLEKEQIVVGRPLPFSVFSAEGKLLLAAGRIVQNEHARQVLLTSGNHRSEFGGNDNTSRGKHTEDYEPVVRVSPLVELQKAYRTARPGHRFALTLARDGSSEAFRSHVIGVHDRIIIVNAPVRVGGSLVVVNPGQVWLCRTFQLTSAFRFSATVLKVAFEPFPHLHLEAPNSAEIRQIRDRTRVAAYALATLESHVGAPCLLVDLSVGGGRIATEDDVLLELGQPIRLAIQLKLSDLQLDLSLEAVVVSVFGATDRNHPQVSFHGIKFQSLTQLELLALHAFVNSQLSMSLNCLWQVLSTAT